MQATDPSYSLVLVAASFLMSAVGAYCALAAAGVAREMGGQVSKLNAALAGLALGGVGIWSMHFLGMMAWDIGTPAGYRPAETVASFALAVGASMLALGYMAAGPFSYKRLLISGPLAGLGVAAMHFVGMASVRFSGYLQWNYGIVLLAILIAVVTATVALWLAFSVRGAWRRVAASLVMALAVCTMHYTGMGAADVICFTGGGYRGVPGLLYRGDLLTMVVTVAVAVVALIGMDVLFQRIVRATDLGVRTGAIAARR